MCDYTYEDRYNDLRDSDMFCKTIPEFIKKIREKRNSNSLGQRDFETVVPLLEILEKEPFNVSIIEKVVAYCEDREIYDKLGDTYSKVKNYLKEVGHG